MTKIIILLFALVLCTDLDTQTVEDSVKAVVKQLFEGMKNSDAQ
jgi:hypothetical protein